MGLTGEQQFSWYLSLVEEKFIYFYYFISSDFSSVSTNATSMYVYNI